MNTPTKLIFVMILLFSSLAIADISSDEEITFFDYITSIPEQSVYEITVEENRITPDDSLTIKVFYQTKYDDVEDYYIDFAFYTPDGLLLEQGFYQYRPHKALPKRVRHALTLTISDSIKDLYGNNKDRVCNMYLGVIGKLYVKTPEGWRVDRFNEDDIHLFEKFLFYCPEIEPPKGCDVEWTDSPECEGDYHVRQNQIRSDCSKVFMLKETCNRERGEMCQEGECVLVSEPEEPSTGEEPDFGFEDEEDIDEEDKEDLIDDQESLDEIVTVWYIDSDNECQSFEITESLADLYYQDKEECQEELVEEEVKDDKDEEMTVKEFVTKYGLVIFIVFLVLLILIIAFRRSQ